MKVEVRPIDREKWHGKKAGESFTRPHKLSALVDAHTMRYATGLTEKEEQEFGQKIDQDLSSHYIPGKEHPFWDSSIPVVKLDNKTMFFNTDNTIDAVKVKMLKASKYVANSMKDYNEGLYPEATHVIYDESEEVEVRATKVALEQEATLALAKLPKARKIQIILIMSGKDMKEQSDSFITVEMADLVKQDPEEVLRYIKQDKSKLADHALVLEALQKNILRKAGHKIMYLDSKIGEDELDAADYLAMDENQDFKLRILKAVNE